MMLKRDIETLMCFIKELINFVNKVFHYGLTNTTIQLYFGNHQMKIKFNMFFQHFYLQHVKDQLIIIP